MKNRFNTPFETRRNPRLTMVYVIETYGGLLSNYVRLRIRRLGVRISLGAPLNHFNGNNISLNAQKAFQLRFQLPFQLFPHPLPSLRDSRGVNLRGARHA